MANIKISKKTFEKEVGKLTPEMQQKIAMFGTTLESFNDEEMELEITPNRPDLLSYQGFKRSFLAFIGKSKAIKKYKINKPEKNYVVNIDKSVQEIRPYTACAIVRKLKFDDDKIKEIIDIQEKLHNTIGRRRKKLAIGIYPLEKITLPIKFKALEPDKIKFQPLESPREMTGLQILQRHPAGRDYSHLLAGKSKFPIFVDGKNKVLSMPPIINSHETGKITEETKDVFIECSGFNFESLKKCLNIIVTTLAEMGGEIYQINLTGNIKTTTPDLTPEKNKVSLENTNKLLGLNLTEKQLKENLEKMGHNYLGKGNLESPSWRTDLLHEVDLIEDVAIAYGYENFIPEIPEISTIGQEDPKETTKRKMSEILSGLGLFEVLNYHLTTKKDLFKKMGIPEKQESNFIELEESKTEYNILRKNLSHYLMKNLSENIDSEYPQKIFEIGKTAKLTTSGEMKEEEKLSIAITPGNYTELKQIIEYLFRMISLKIKIKEATEISPHLIDGRTGEIFLEETKIGEIGEVHPKILKNWKIKMPVTILEINLKEIFEKIN
jgi:phenylalanyl-tRNA synthetase beta chain